MVVSSSIQGLRELYPEKAKKIQQRKQKENWEEYLEECIDEMNRRYSHVMVGTKHRIIEEVVNEFGFSEYLYYQQKELEMMYQKHKVKVGIGSHGSDVMKNKLKAWSEHERCNVYTGGVIFDPSNSHNENQFNTWRGFAVEPKQGDWDLIMAHIEEVICAGDDNLITYFYNWCAYIFQKPDKPGMAAIVCRGEKGSGKGVIGHFLRSIWGSHGIHISNGQHLVGRFNGHLESTCFLFADEAFFGGDKKNEGVLKALITDDTLIIERKGIDSKQCKNHLKVFMATNLDFAVMASKDERRYCVCDVSSHRINDKKYFDALRAATASKDVQAAFLWAMLQRNIDGFSPAKIPETQGLKDQREDNLDSIGKWLLDTFEMGYFPTGSSDKNWDYDRPSSFVYDSYLYWCDQQKVDHYGRYTATKFGRYLSNIGFLKSRSNSSRGWHFGHFEAAKEKFYEYEKVGK